MRIVISVDMEGIGGIVDRVQLMPGERLYQESRAYMVAEMKSVVRAVWAHGATEVLVNDSHDGMLNLAWSELGDLPRGTKLLSGTGKRLSMGQGFPGSAAAMFVGYHARAGTAPAVMDHTYSGDIHHLALNGQEVGETGLNAYLAGFYGVPVALVTGDQALVAEARALLPEVEAVTTKEALGRRSALLPSPADLADQLEAAAGRAMDRLAAGRGPAPLSLAGPVDLEVGFMTTQAADTACLMPGTRRVDGRTVAATLPSVETAFFAFRALMVLGGGTPLY